MSGLVDQLNAAMSARIGVRVTDDQRQRLHDSMQEMIEDILTDIAYGPSQSVRAARIIIVAPRRAAG
jgi:hypothetical protein